MDRKEAVRISRTLAHALRHAPWLYELELDEGGWVTVEQVLEGLRRHRRAWAGLRVEDLEMVVFGFEKQRYEMREGRIRAYYGHSLPKAIRREPARPPDLLYHGTAIEAVPLILETGLKPMNRQYVHFSADRETALDVGARKGSQVALLVIRAGEAYQAGVPFYHGYDQVWLADGVPARYIDMVDAAPDES